MNVHPATEVLSAYLDRELVDVEQREVASHVEECQGCQHRLDGLRRVVDQLQQVPSARPPMALARGIETQVARSRRSRILGPARRPTQIELPNPVVGLGFALTVGFAMILYFFAQSSIERADPRSRVILSPAGESPPLPEGQRVSAGGRSFVLREGVWLQSSLAAEPPVNKALAPARAAELAEEYRWLGDLVALGRDVVFVTDGGETVRVSASPGLPG